MGTEQMSDLKNLPGIELEVLHFPFDVNILSSLIHSVPLRVYAKDRQGRFIFANLNYCQNVGKSLTEILGKTDYDIHPTNLAEKYLADDQMIMSSRKTRMIEESWQSFDGEIQHIQVVKTPLLDNLNPDEVLGTLGVFWDITEKKQAELQIEEERTFLRKVIDSIPAYIYVKDLNGNFIIANRSVAEFMGADSPEVLVGKNDFDFYPRDVALIFLENEKKLIKENRSITDVIEQFTYKGKEYWLNTTKNPLKNRSGEIIGLVGVGHDVTHIKLIENQLRESEERYAAVVNQALEGIYLINPITKKVFDSNESFRNLLGYSREELHGLKVYEFVIHNHQEIDQNIKSVSISSELPTIERNYRHKKGHLLSVEVSAKSITYTGDQAILVVVRDISEKKAEEAERERLKEQLRQAQKFEALGTLAGGVAHDLNNILAGIVSYPELIMSKLPPGSELIKPLTTIKDSGLRASTVVADLLTIARSAASNKSVHDLHLIIGEYLDSPECKELLSENNEVKLQCQLEAKDSTILCSPVHIKKCLMNLVGNASEALGGEGAITIKTGNCQIAQEETGREEQREINHVLLQIIDTGPGISEEDRERIFEPFYTKKEMGRSGTGLGLTVVWNTVLDHGGSVSVEADQNGTCFSLHFPHERAGIIPYDDTQSHLEKTEKGEHILVIDDDEMLRDIASQMLAELGYKVSSVSSGEEGVRFVEENSVDLLVIDMLMDPGINGRVTYERISKRCPGIKALIVSGYAEDNEVKQTLRLGANGFVQKPYSIFTLSQAIKKALT
ncbi:MAG: PAS domain-containing sensor histidine kinase [Desulfobulbaceae bacterium]|nr:MAG: PAS domain-containing sensor histidine kinase [Desulfobulbaceae bacterium]